MAKDYGEMEQEFIATLKGDTGKDLAEWMSVIAAQNFANKNDAIDWLRVQGFAFARASWLERIHANGGKPLYAGKPAATAVKSPSPRKPAPVRETRPEATPPPVSTTPGAQRIPDPEPVPVSDDPAPAADAALDDLIAAAKGYQPLYRLLASAIVRTIPGVHIAAAASHISVSGPREFAAIETSAKGLRLALDLGSHAFAAPWQPSKLTTAPKNLSHMIILDDARKVDTALIDLIRVSHGRVNA
jgi:hypothetical protein